MSEKPECPYKDGDLLEIVRGEFRGEIVRVHGRACFYEATDMYYDGDPNGTLCSKKGWQIVIQRNTAHGSLALTEDGWVDLLRWHEDEISRMTRRV